MKIIGPSFRVACVLLITATTVFSGSKDTFIKATPNTVKTLDPASCANSACGMKIRNVYETLIQYSSDTTEKFLPLLSTRVPSLVNGGISQGGTRYQFEIRKNVRFHNGELLTPEDVEYSLERVMILDQKDGPANILLEAILGQGYTITRSKG